MNENNIQEYEKALKTLRESDLGSNADQKGAIVNGITNFLLAREIENLCHQIPITISELRSTISRNADNIIASNTALSNSNEKHTIWMKWLTVGLLITSVAQVIVALINQK